MRVYSARANWPTANFMRQILTGKGNLVWLSKGNLVRENLVGKIQRGEI